jgi:hypothetical protein
MTIEGFTCECEVKTMSDWIKEEDPEQCHICLIEPTASAYIGTLEDAGAKDQIKSLEESWQSNNPLTIAEQLDKIKQEVGDDLKKELITLDCFAQSFKPEQQKINNNNE